MYRLYGTTNSGAAAVEAALRRCRQRFEWVEAASWTPGPALDELARLNPLQQIPTLVLPAADGGGVMTESAAILMHLGLRHPQSGLLPEDPAARAQALRGLVFIAANCYPAIGIIDYPERWISPSDSDGKDRPADRLRRGSRARLHRHWDLFAQAFGEQLAAAGEAPRALDLLAAVVSRWAGSRAHCRRRQPALLAAFERTEAHPSVAAVFRRHWP